MAPVVFELTVYSYRLFGYFRIEANLPKGYPGERWRPEGCIDGVGGPGTARRGAAAALERALTGKSSECGALLCSTSLCLPP